MKNKQQILSKIKELEKKLEKKRNSKNKERLLRRCETLKARVEKALKFSAEAKKLRVVKEGEKIKNVSITLPTQVAEIDGFNQIFYKTTIIDEKNILLSSGCAPFTDAKTKFEKRFF